MPLVAGGLLISILLLLQVFGLLALHKTSLPLVRGLLGSMAEQKGFRKWFFHAIGLTALVNSIAWVVQRVRQSIANAVLPNLGVTTLWLQSYGNIAHWTYKELGDGWANYAQSWALFRHKTFPHALKAAVLPATVGARHAGQLAGRSISLGNATRIRLGRSIDRLKKETGLLAGILLGIDILVKGSHAHRHHTDHTRVLPKAASDAAHAGSLAGRLAEELADAKARLKAIEKAVGLGIIAAAIYKVLARVAPWLFCRNVKKLGNVACGINPDILNTLTALLLGTLAIEDLDQLARFTLEVEKGVADEVKRLLNA
jgi:hypothetical protein